MLKISLRFRARSTGSVTLGKCFPSVTQFPICTVKGLEGVALQGGTTPPLSPSSSVVSKSNIEMQCRGATLSLVESEDRAHEQCRGDSSSKKGKDAKEIINHVGSCSCRYVQPEF